jgi:hypothetical protein
MPEEQDEPAASEAFDQDLTLELLGSDRRKRLAVRRKKDDEGQDCSDKDCSNLRS